MTVAESVTVTVTVTVTASETRGGELEPREGVSKR